MPRSAGHEGDSGLAREAAPRVGHVHRRGLVPHVNEPEFRVERGVEDGHDVIPGKREDVARSGERERTRDEICPAQDHSLLPDAERGDKPVVQLVLLAHEIFGFRLGAHGRNTA